MKHEPASSDICASIHTECRAIGGLVDLFLWIPMDCVQVQFNTVLHPRLAMTEFCFNIFAFRNKTGLIWQIAFMKFKYKIKKLYHIQHYCKLLFYKVF